MAVRLNKSRKAWFVDIRYDHGKRFRKYSPENTKAGAEAYQAVMRQKLARGEDIEGNEQEQQKQTFGQFAPNWYANYVISNNKPSEQRAKRYALVRELVPFFGKMPIEEITVRHIEQFKAEQLKKGLARKTVNNQLAVFSKCLAIAYEWLNIAGAPPKIVWLKCPPPSTNFLSADECSLILNNSEGVLREMILFALRTGMRHGEITGLQWSSIDWQNRIITVRHSRCPRTGILNSPKSNKERHIPMDVDVYELLFKRKKSTGYVFLNKGNSYGAEALIRHLRNVRQKVGLRQFSWHTLRHTFATHLAIKGAPLHVVQALLGHSAIQTTMRYAHVAPSALRTAIDMLNPKQLVLEGFGQPVGNQWSAQETTVLKKH